MNVNEVESGHGNVVAEHTHNCRPAPRRAVLVNDQLIPMPDRHVKVSAIKDQATVPSDHALVRDHNSPHDLVMPDHGIADLAQGTVFYSVPACEVTSPRNCSEPAKRVVAVDDRWEVVIKTTQTARSVRDLFGLPGEVELLRDFESPIDEVLGDDAQIDLSDGEVFRTRKRADLLVIVVNKKRFTQLDGVKPTMTGREIAALVYDKPDATSVWKKEGAEETPVRMDEALAIHNCDEFKVIRNDVNAGFRADRIERELALLRVNGVRATLVSEAVPAVIFHDIPTRAGHPTPNSDVLVKVPGGYPAAFIDNAFLPEGSPLLGRVPGAVQGVETLGGRLWRQISIHPHAGNGASWNKDLHGFHTYYDELLSWLHKAQ